LCGSFASLIALGYINNCEELQEDPSLIQDRGVSGCQPQDYVNLQRDNREKGRVGTIHLKTSNAFKERDLKQVFVHDAT
jgi:hypothetical protein